MTQSGHAQLLMCGSSCKFALMAIGRSKGGDMRDPDDTYQNQLVPIGRADHSRRARLRHLFATFEGAHHLHHWPDRRRHGHTGCRAATVPGSREPEEGNLDVHQLPGRDGDLVPCTSVDSGKVLLLPHGIGGIATTGAFSVPLNAQAMLLPACRACAAPDVIIVRLPALHC